MAKKSPSKVVKKQKKKINFLRAEGANSSGRSKFYSKEQFLKDVTTKDNSLAIGSKKGRVSQQYKASIENFASALIEFSKKPKTEDLTQFLMLYDMPPSTFFDLKERHPALKDAYELALANVSYNNFQALKRKMPQGAQTAALTRDRLFNPFIQRILKQQRKENERMRIQVLEEVAKLKAEMQAKQAEQPRVIVIRDSADIIVKEQTNDDTGD